MNCLKNCKEYPLILGYREVSYEDWLQQQVIEYRTQVVDKNNLSFDVTRDNEILISFSKYLHKRGILKVVEENIPIRVKLFLNRKTK
jgi:hypothetical protein